MNKSTETAYFSRKLKNTSRQIIWEEVEDAPISKLDRYFMFDIMDGLSYKELSLKYNKSQSAIYQWKRRLFTAMARYDRRNLR